MTDSERNRNSTYEYVNLRPMILIESYVRTYVRRSDASSYFRLPSPIRFRSAAELRELLSMMDTSKDGQIDFEEFMSAISAKLSTIDATEFVDIAYDSFDRDRDNKIGSGDLRQGSCATLTLYKTIVYLTHT